MEPINLHNYEAYLLDYIEGRLDEDALNALRVFAQAHPELEITLEEATLPSVKPENLAADFKVELLKDMSAREEKLCSYVESLMPESERKMLEKEAEQDQQLAAELKIYSRTLLQPDADECIDKNSLYQPDEMFLFTEGLLSAEAARAFGLRLEREEALREELRIRRLLVLQPDTSISFPRKNTLKKRGAVIRLFGTQTFAAAAALFLVAALFIIFRLLDTDQTPVPIANNTTPVKVQPAVPAVKHAVREASAPSSYNSEQQLALKKAQQANPIASSQSLQVQNHPQDSPDTAIINLAVSQPVTPTQLSPDSADIKQEQLVVNRSQSRPDSVAEYISEEALAFDRSDEEQVPRTSFWHRLTQLAGEANKLGVKGIDGEITPGNGFRFTLRSFSVEKK